MTHGLPYPNSHLSNEDRLAKYLGQLEAAAKVQADYRRASTFDGEVIPPSVADELRELSGAGKRAAEGLLVRFEVAA